MTSDIESRIQALIADIFNLLGVQPDFAYSKEGEAIYVEINMDQPGVFIGREGIGIESLQYIVHRIIRKEYPEVDMPQILIDIGGYKKHREEELSKMARDIADRVSKSGESFLMRPMKAWERRIVHVTLKEKEELLTESEDTEEGRRVRIKPGKHNRNDKNPEDSKNKREEGPE
jgi:spoIIIJ-associated protein